jgi:hypothetical protein
MSTGAPILVLGAAARVGVVGGAVVEFRRRRDLPVRASVGHTSARTALPPICGGCVANTVMWRPAGFLDRQRELTRVNAT